MALEVIKADAVVFVQRVFAVGTSVDLERRGLVDRPTIAPSFVSLPSTTMPYSVPSIILGNTTNNRPAKIIAQVECLLMPNSRYKINPNY